MENRYLVFIAVCLLCGSWAGVSAAKLEYDWTAQYGFKSPDCVDRMVVTVNGEYPGPAIHGTVGDEVTVRLTNHLLSEAVTIHWHGLKMTGNQWMDGTASVTQCPLLPGETFTYTFTFEEPGTHWWHGHVGLQMVEGFEGAIVVTDPNPPAYVTYDEEMVVIVSDWYQQDARVIAAGLASNPFRWPGDSDSILFNGKGRSATGYASCNATAAKTQEICTECDREIFTVEAGKTYRLRVINMGSVQLLTFSIAGHNMTVIEADGTYTEPYVTSELDINLGQRYSVLVTASEAVDNYFMQLGPKLRPGPMGLAYFHYTGAAVPDQTKMSPDEWDQSWDPYIPSSFDINQIKTHSSYRTTIPDPDVTINLLQAQTWIPDTTGHLYWPINGKPLKFPDTPTLMAAYYNVSDPESQTQIFEVEKDQVVDVVMQNTVATNGVCEQHPWHLHGHSFWVVASGAGEYNASNVQFNTEDAIVVDTTTLYPSQWNEGGGTHDDPCGWLVIRFKADNIGSWIVHCHVPFHLEMGMGVIINIDAHLVDAPPADMPVCGKLLDSNKQLFCDVPVVPDDSGKSCLSHASRHTGWNPAVWLLAAAVVMIMH